MKKSVVFSFVIMLLILCMTASCGLANADDGTSSASDFADKAPSTHVPVETSKPAGLEEGGADPTDNISIINPDVTVSPLPTTDAETLGNDLIDDLGTTASDAGEAIHDGLHDLTEPDAGATGSTSGTR